MREEGREGKREGKGRGMKDVELLTTRLHKLEKTGSRGVFCGLYTPSKIGVCFWGVFVVKRHPEKTPKKYTLGLIFTELTVW